MSLPAASVAGMKREMKVILQWVFVGVAALVVGPIAGWAVSAQLGVDGSGDATMLLGASPMVGVLGHGGAFLLAAGLGLVVTRVLGGRYGLFCAGVVLAWGAARSGRVEAVLAADPVSGVLTTLAFEGLILAAATAALAWLVCRDTQHENPAKQEKAISGETVLAIAAGLVAGGIGAWLAAQDDLKGQTIASAGVGGALGAVAARVFAHRSAGWAVVLGVCLAGVAGPLLASRVGLEMVLGGLFRGDITRSLASLVRIAPLDWAAGALMGVPIGMTWAGSLVEKHVPDGESSGKAAGAGGA